MSRLPVLKQLRPSHPPTTGNFRRRDRVTITGLNLTGAESVKFGTKAGTITADSASSITAASPAESAGLVDVTVTIARGRPPTSSSDRFTYASTVVITPCQGSISEDSEIVAGKRPSTARWMSPRV